MPERKTLERARRDKRQGKAASTQAGEFVREEMHHIREGKHGARSTKQAIAIGLSKARRAGVRLRTPKKGTTSERTRKAAARASREGQSGRKKKTSARRSRAVRGALRSEFVREEMHHIREGKHGARSTKQAIAIGLSKARRAGVRLRTPKKGTTSERTRKAAARASREGQSGRKKKTSARRSRAVRGAL